MSSDVVTEVSSANLALSRGAERTLMRRIIIGIAVATPVCIGIWVGLIAYAVRDSGRMAGPIGIAVGIGALSGLYLGTWAGSVASSNTFDEIDRFADTMEVPTAERSSSRRSAYALWSLGPMRVGVALGLGR